jgi:NADH-quinone oxidoreductase subunit L
MYIRNEPWPRSIASRFAALRPAIERKWYVDSFYVNYIVNPTRRLSDWFAGAVDRQIIDNAVNGVSRIGGQLGERVRTLQTGAIPAYALSIFVGVAVIVAYFVFSV